MNSQDYNVMSIKITIICASRDAWFQRPLY